MVFPQALNSKGLRQHLTIAPECIGRISPSPEFKGIKTHKRKVYAQWLQVFPQALNSKGLRLNSNVFRVVGFVFPQALNSKGLRHGAQLVLVT